jgi:hypothetical protein
MVQTPSSSGRLTWDKHKSFFTHCDTHTTYYRLRKNYSGSQAKVFNQFRVDRTARGGLILAPKDVRPFYDNLRHWLRSPGQHIIQSDDKVDRRSPVLIRNHA